LKRLDRKDEQYFDARSVRLAILPMIGENVGGIPPAVPWAPIMRRRRPWFSILGFLALGVALLVYAAWPGRVIITVSPETTVVTGPLDQHGFVDYQTPLNEQLSRGVTPENNANVLIWQALGPHPERSTMPPEYFQWLAIDSPSENGDYLVNWGDYLKENVKGWEDPEKRNELLSRTDRAGKWPWTANEQPELADWLKRIEKPLALAAAASRRSEYYNPLVSKKADDGSPGLLIGALLPSVQKCRELATALTCRAMLRLGERNTAAAWQDLLACHRLGRLVGRGATLIELLVGIALDQIASRADLAFIDHAKLTSKQLLACLNDLQQLPPMPSVADKIDLFERFMTLEAMIVVAHRGWPAINDLSGYTAPPPKEDDLMGRMFMQSINWDPALKNANRWCDRCVAAARLPDHAAREEEWAAITRDLKALRQQVSGTGLIARALKGPDERGEILGNILICLLFPAVEKVQGAADRVEQAQRNLYLAFALAAYQRDNGRYPAKLAELTPKYLAKIPDDLFAGKPLIYRLEDEGFLLYSVGPNGIDDNGRGAEDDPRGDDIPIRLPVPKPRGNE
jgi:hypothetical protein